MIKLPFQLFRKGEVRQVEGEYARFCEEHNWWLADYALFMSIREALEEKPWQSWPGDIKRREPAALTRYREDLGEAIAFHYFLQFCFFRQWHALRAYARKNGIQIIGDVPLYVAGDSVDVWSNTGIFLLDKELNPLKVAGVPPLQPENVRPGKD